MTCYILCKEWIFQDITSGIWLQWQYGHFYPSFEAFVHVQLKMQFAYAHNMQLNIIIAARN